MITWDEPKRKTNLKKHGIDLADLESAFDFPMVTVEEIARTMVNYDCKVWHCGVNGSSFWCGQSGKTPRI